MARGREALPRNRRNRFSAFRNPGSSTAGNHVMASRRTTPPRFTGDSTRDLTLESPQVSKRQSDDSTLESSRHKLLIVWSASVDDSMSFEVVGKSYTNHRRLKIDRYLKVILRNLIKPNQLIIRSYLQNYNFCVVCKVFSW